MKLQKPKGTQDILPQESAKWQYVEDFARKTFRKYNYGEIRTPIFEHYEVISRSVGDTTDIVTKEMYDFYDKGDRHITLRPEGTAPVVRSYVENKLFAPEVQKPVKVYYMGSMFRYERPQAGRLREFHQIGAECFGSSNPATDVEMIAMAAQFFKDIGITNVSLELNSLGNPESRAAYRQALIDYLTPLKPSLSADSQRRLEENPLRVLDSKEPEDKAAVEGAPSILDYLDEESSAYFAAVRSMLETLQIPYVINTNMVRGLDYYNHTIFEFTTEVAGSQLTICAGGRYDGLVAYFGGPETPGVGFGMGLERLLLVLDKQGVELPIETALDVYVAVLGAGANGRALELVQALRAQGFAAERDYLDRKLKAQFKSADIFKAKTLITLGESEVESGQVTVKNNHNREEITVSLDQIQENYQLIFEKLGF
ncbi:histidine--tRNA ligase [Streptococcus sanguinis]|jgi:histidine--tRNA ligase|uniref:Histidine--tRNA ligase n=2 Tax=Streptococcus sanguinis TaxID=1305 RepID=A0A2X3V5I9_STRSA|nr:histidine--tRNA ligase [Streptococcus sanguinis]EGC23877.1 histidine--tRNA ligase [Streptococcus sanguinis SK405]EGC28063.1 histidine--tRNA ligase [Streptococcus sanguinis SK678]EGJ41295.1 histidine--tRNA ligase [Streptococcus sanguinis SK1059]EGQ18256.1 histidine--tRNA ligase [Streptococcus sanguinis ATCC 29667]EGQ25877.1 histidine--tRNA ligase [Streptococcus sanguinis SK340]